MKVGDQSRVERWMQISAQDASDPTVAKAAALILLYNNDLRHS